jgi:hypothetical protein
MVINWIYRLFPVNDIQPADSLRLADLAQIGLGGLKVLMPQNHLGHDLQRDPVSAGCGGVWELR